MNQRDLNERMLDDTLYEDGLFLFDRAAILEAGWRVLVLPGNYVDVESSPLFPRSEARQLWDVTEGHLSFVGSADAPPTPVADCRDLAEPPHSIDDYLVVSEHLVVVISDAEVHAVIGSPEVLVELLDPHTAGSASDELGGSAPSLVVTGG